MREVIFSRSLAKRFQHMVSGDTLQLARSDWKVVGIFDTGGTACDSEIWADCSEIALEWNRPIYSSILLRAESASVLDDISQHIWRDRRINLQAPGIKKLPSVIVLRIGLQDREGRRFKLDGC